MEDDDEEIKKIYWRIGEVADMLGVEHSCIRFWLEWFDLDVDKRDHKGSRMFTRQEVEMVVEIHRLMKIELYTLEGARRQLELKGAVREFMGNPVKVHG